MKQWLLCLSLGLSMSAMAMTDDSQQCEFLVEGGNPITDTHLGFADGVVLLEGCEEGLFVFSDTTSRQRRVGFVDKFGNQVIEPSPDIVFARPFRDGVAIVGSPDGKFGLINPKGKWVLKPTYDSIFEFNHGVAIAMNKHGDDFDHALIDTTGREVIAMQTASIKEFMLGDVMKFKVDRYDSHENKMYSGLYNQDGTVLIPMDNHRIDYNEVSDLIKLCHQVNGCVFLDKKLNKLTEVTYDNDSPAYSAVGDDLIVVKKNDKFGFIEISNPSREVIVPMYDFADRFSHGVAVVKSGKRYFLIDKHNQQVSSEYDLIFQFDDYDFYVVQQNDQFGVINHTGELIQPLIFEQVDNRFSKEMVNIRQHGLWGLMDSSGRIVITPQYQAIHHYRDGLIAVKKNGKWGFVNERNETMIDFIYDDPLIDIKDVMNYLYYYVVKEGMIAVVKNGKWGVIDTTGEVVADFIYDDIEYINAWHIAAIKDGEQVLIELEPPVQ